MSTESSDALKQLLAMVEQYKPTHPDNTGKELLINELKTKPQSAMRDHIICNAQRNHYSDFKSYWATPALMLVAHLTQAGFDDMVQKATHGMYDHDG